MVDTVRVGGARLTFEADDSRYQRTVSRVFGSQRRLRRDYRDTARAARINAAATNQLVGSLRAYLGIASVGATAGLAVSAVRDAARISDLAEAYGVTTDTLQEYRHAAADVGIAQRTFDTALQRATRRIGEAAQGQGELLKTVQELGIAVRDANGNVRSSEEVLADFADAIQSAGTQSERLRIAFRLFDAEGARLVTLFQRGAAGIAELREEARATGQVLDSDLVESAKELTQEFDIFTGRIQVGFQTAVVTLAQNTNILAGAGTAVAGVFAGRVAQGFVESTRAARELRLEQVAGLAAAQEAARRQALAAATEARLAQVRARQPGFAGLAAVTAVAPAQRRAAEAVEAHAAAQARLRTATSLAARASTLASRALSFLGGPLGAVLVGVGALTAAWGLLGGESESAIDRIEGAVDRLRASAAGGRALTAGGRTLEEIRDQIEREREILAGVLAQIEDPQSTTPRGRRAERARLDRERAGIEANIARLQELEQQAEQATAGLAAQDSTIATLQQSYARLATSIEDPTRRARDLAREIADSARADLELARLRARFDADSLAGAQALAIARARRDVTDEQVRAERELADARRDLFAQGTVLDELRAARDRAELGSEERRIAEATVKTAEARLETIRQQNVLLLRQLGHLDDIQLAEEDIAAAVAVQRAARTRAVVDTELQAAIVDRVQAAQASEDYVASLRQEAEARRAAARIEARIAVEPIGQREGLRRQLEIEQEFTDRLAAARRASARADDLAAQSLAAYNAELERVRDLGARATETELSRLGTLRQTAEAQAQSAAQLRATAQGFQDVTDVVAATAEEIGDVLDEQARRANTFAMGVRAALEEQARGASDLAGQAQRAVEQAFGAMEDAVVDFALRGRLSFSGFIDSVLADLARLAVRQTLIDPLTGALFGALGGTGGLTGTVPGVAHSGGIVGHLPRFAGPGLRSRERLVVLETGEEILTRRDPRHRFNLGSAVLAAIRSAPRFHDGGVVGGDRRGAGAAPRAMEVRVEVTNRSRAQVQASDVQARETARGLIVGVVLEDAQRRGPITRTLAAMAR